MTHQRRVVQQRHERFQVQLLLEHLRKCQRANYVVLSEPNPPEAIISTGKTTSWIEVVSAFWNGAYAKGRYSEATPGESHAPIGDGVFTNMTPEFARNFTTAVQAKLGKTSYVPVRDRHGPGYLVVAVLFPFFGRDAFDWIEKEWLARQYSNLGCFRSIYLTVQVSDVYKVIRWRPPK